MSSQSRSVRKHHAIMDAARSLFLRNGYSGTSMDEIAALAAVSKQTVYKNFIDKERLFIEIITADIAQAQTQTQTNVQALASSDDIAADLRDFARRHITIVLQPHLVQMRRVIIAVADRFPDLATTWYASGPGRAHTTLATQFEELTRRGLLRTPDPLLAAQHFNWLVLSIPLNQLMFSPEEFTQAQFEHYADEGVRVFLAAYGT
ncbi:TetR family transcriptional regulator [Acrocarpospora pleiomorpha]|uniref:TetR family transcriptional regulator n=2 Tax=Acrocarpospora pleiomorpha TaxID=90975 RepID=A0A5M3XHX3_9ACTN|nr:TetR/AcrR family transcriptional regulator [Acrocarpospora pleiomorpha]GES19819.1 TetR family transcriptional regulator [Acrocarpospora pleiomorpha]